MPERQPITINARPHPLQPTVYTCEVQYGATIAELLPDAHPQTHVYIGGLWVPRERWAHVRPKPGAIIEVKIIAAGGDGGDNKVLRTVLQIAVVAVALYTGVYVGGFWGAVAQAGIVIAGNLAINALVPPQLPQQSLSAGADSFNRKLSVTGTRNNANPYGAVPCVFGRHLVFPPWQAAPFTEVLGENQFLRGLLCLGYGPMSVYNIRIGDTPIANFDDVEYEISGAPALFTGTVDETPLALSWDKSTVQTSYTQNTAIDTDEISMDITFPTGLFAVGDDGSTGRADVRYVVEYRAAGSADPWLNALNAAGIQFSAAWIKQHPTLPQQILMTGWARETRRAGIRWKVPRGQYEVRVHFWSWQTYVGSQDSQWFVDSTWTALRSFTHETPIQNMPNCQFMAFRIRATDQLSGITDRINMEISRHVQVWNDVTDTWSYQESSNPAWQYLDPLIGVAAKGSQTERDNIRDTRVNKQEIKAWADDCTANGWDSDGVIDAPTTRFQLMRDIAVVGRAAFDNYNGQYTVVRDTQQTVPTQLFTPRNSWGFSGSLPTVTLPHALRVWYVDPASGWQRREKIVYRDGFDDTNATHYEELDARFVTDQNQAWRYGRYYLKSLELRREQFTLNADVEHIACRRGDLVHVGTEVIKAGLGFGRVKSTVVDGSGNATSITLDDTITMEAGKSYAIRLRRDDGTQDYQAITTNAGDTDTVAPTVAMSDVDIGDLVAVMETTEKVLALKVRAILPSPDFTAQLQLVPQAPTIHDVDSETPPTPDGPLSLVIDPAMFKCCPPVVDSGGARSDDTVLLPNTGGIDSPVIHLPVKHQEP